MAIVTDTDPEELTSRVIHEWHRMGGVRLQIKELQTFESETILLLLNIFTATNKKIHLAELHEILTAAQSQIQEQDPTESGGAWRIRHPTAPLLSYVFKIQNYLARTPCTLKS